MLYEVKAFRLEEILKGLNPCSNGICSTRVLLRTTAANCRVLILVLMEYALRARGFALISMRAGRLNPCSNGICSTSGGSKFQIQFNNGS